LLFHLGVSVDLVYGPTSSGMYNHKAAYSLRTCFKYSPETRYLYRDSTTLNWDSVIIAHLDRKMPLYYAGWSVPNINGHAFVCDGYQGSDYFHFNFGWSGSNNGYYYIDNLTPGGNNFNLAQELIINIYPDTVNYSYPSNCAGQHILHYNQGSITDGSGPVEKYQPGSDCSWLIDPQTATDSITKINLAFDRFETGTNDVVTVYDGADANAAVLGSYSGSTLPGTVSSSGNKMFITFMAQGGGQAAGWSANYSTTSPVWCQGQKTITGDSAVITDGSLSFNYNNNSLCRWLITPPDQTKPLTVYFYAFDTETDKDFLSIYDPDTQAKLVSISGHYNSTNLPDSVTSPSGKMLLLFTSSSNVTAGGFTLYYPRWAAGVIETSDFMGLKIFPNPVHDKVNVEFRSPRTDHLNTVLSTMQGKIIRVSEEPCVRGENKIEIPVAGLSPGIYLLRLQNEKTTETYKIVVTDE
jgi:hypothetical protein